jgi:cobalt-zinc-cadmium efflux system outer membrane protein
MQSQLKLLVMLAIGTSATLTPCLAQPSPPRTQEQMHHHEGDLQPVQPVYPRMGRAQEQAAGRLFTLEQAERLAGESNPTLRQAEAEIRASKARQQQAGLYLNPTVGYTGDEIRGGSIDGGKQGFFLQQTIVTGGKLGKNRAVFEKEAHLAELEAEEQKLRVQNAVKTAFYRVLAAQELLDARRGLAQIEQSYAEVQGQLFNTGQADESEVLEAEVDAQRRRLSARMQENTLREEWKSLAALIGHPDLPQVTVAGDLENAWPQINEEQVLETIATQSPATGIADAASARAATEIIRAKSQALPDLEVRAGLQYNNESLGTVPRDVGWEGLVEFAVQLPVFNRNQGNVAAAIADLERTQLEKQRVALTLRKRAATILDTYANAKMMALDYRDEMLPRAQKAYSLLSDKYGLMLTAYPRVLEAQRKLYALHAEYIMALETTWTTGIALEGFLLTDGLEAPARPSEVDRTLRETNLPMPERTMSPFEEIPRP